MEYDITVQRGYGEAGSLKTNTWSMTSRDVVTEHAGRLFGNERRRAEAERGCLTYLVRYPYLKSATTTGGRKSWVHWLVFGGKALWVKFEKSSGKGFEPRQWYSMLLTLISH